MTVDAALRAGVAPLSSEAGQPLHARRYQHPALGNRPTIKLVGEQVAEAEDQTLRFLGFDEPQVSKPLSRTELHGLGYPAWALINDPDNGALALAAVPGMEKGARLARHSPAQAQGQFDVIAETLPRHHQPSFYDQAGRLFLNADRQHYARMMFSRARKIERVYALTVDEALRQETFLEFAFAGALPVKAITEYVAELKERYSPGETLRLFTELVLGRTKGGLPPWSGLPKQLRTLAKAAEVDVDETERQLLASLLSLPTAKLAPSGFWTGCAGAIVALARDDDDAARTLLHLIPKPPGYDQSKNLEFYDWWFAQLGKANVFDKLISPIDIAAWVSHVAKEIFPGQDSTSAAPTSLLRQIEKWKDLTEEIDLEAGNAWRSSINLDLLSTCLSHNIRVKDPTADCTLLLRDWLPHGVCDLAPVAFDNRFRDLLYSSLNDTASAIDKLASPKLTSITEGWLLHHAKLAQRGISDLGASLRYLNTKLSTLQCDSVSDAIDAIDVASITQNSIRFGLYSEFGWEAFDAAAAELGSNLHTTSSWPFLTMYNQSKAITIGPSGRVAEHELRVPANSRTVTVFFSHGEFAVFWEYEYFTPIKCYWSSDASRVLEAPDRQTWMPRFDMDLGFVLMDKDGAAINGHQAFSYGQANCEPSQQLAFDGKTYWRKWNWTEIDPATGELGRQSLPSVFERGGGEAPKSISKLSSLVPLPSDLTDSPLGTDGQYLGFKIAKKNNNWHITGVDGRNTVVSIDRAPEAWGIIAFPGSEHSVVLDGLQHSHIVNPADGSRHWKTRIDSHVTPPPAFWHFMSPRNTEDSMWLREITKAEILDLIEAASNDLQDKLSASDSSVPKDSMPRLKKRIDATPLRTTEIRSDLAALITVAAKRQQLLHQLRKVNVVSSELAIDPEAMENALKDLLPRRSVDSLEEQITTISNFLNGTISPQAVVEQRYTTWTNVLDKLALIAVRARSCVSTDIERKALKQFLTLLAESPLTASGTRTGTVDSKPDQVPAAERNNNGAYVVLNYNYQDNQKLFVSVGSAIPPGKVAFNPDANANWGSNDRLKAFIDKLGDDDEPQMWDPLAVDKLAELTGLKPNAALLLLTGLKNMSAWESDFLGKETRSVLNLKRSDADRARKQLAGLSVSATPQLYELAFGEDPLILWDTDKFVERLAAAWNKLVGKQTAIPDSTFDILEAQLTGISTSKFLHTAFESDSTYTGKDLLSNWLGRSHSLATLIHRQGHQLLSAVKSTAQVSYEYLRADDPVKKAVPTIIARARRALDDPSLLLFSTYGQNEFPPDLLTGKSVNLPMFSEPVNDYGVIVENPNQYGSSVYFRPALLGDDPVSKTIRTILDCSTISLVDWIRSSEADQLCELIQNLDGNRYETNPQDSAPEIVKAMASSLSLSTNASTLYLQLLALASPSDKNIRLWNSWKPAVHKAAVEELRRNELVVTAKRARAGRSIFLPGEWTEQYIDVPCEAWTLNLRNEQGPFLHTLFEAAWRRVESGDGPR